MCGLWQGNASVARGAGASWLACTRDTRPPPATSSSTTQRATFHLHNHLPVQKTVCLRPAFAVPRGLPGTIARGRLGPGRGGNCGDKPLSAFRPPSCPPSPGARAFSTPHPCTGYMPPHPCTCNWPFFLPVEAHRFPSAAFARLGALPPAASTPPLSATSLSCPVCSIFAAPTLWGRGDVSSARQASRAVGAAGWRHWVLRSGGASLWLGSGSTQTDPAPLVLAFCRTLGPFVLVQDLALAHTPSLPVFSVGVSPSSPVVTQTIEKIVAAAPAHHHSSDKLPGFTCTLIPTSGGTPLLPCVAPRTPPCVVIMFACQI
ncbi:hypothetical protein PICMEDRAFT_129217 [Pichia membranifaciens NRRL Y-2026]|uniref:Uncharacterized protein n=1 Tax=Pichia membranifaciens NRRL Y-2026 TaxID=763406 RepID=A0A1E3NJU7_9ASCO|nr:hypothetical protein PICMEDRAFT_129217 [Pichia membranifaciens NRRL Y-2026]ODQ46399.1 hypothetical protein PICMEDRAFT_129217 [Pichia membranifaciens NRRL Y-2026]